MARPHFPPPPLQADLLQTLVVRPNFQETTVLGAALAAGGQAIQGVQVPCRSWLKCAQKGDALQACPQPLCASNQAML